MRIKVPSYAKKVFVLTSEWVAVIAPFDCDYFGMRNTGNVAIDIRTTLDDATTQDTIATSTQEPMIVPFVRTEHGWLRRFIEAEVVAWVRSATGAEATMTVTWIK